MMCVKMPATTGESFSSWLFGYQSFLQGDSEWLHQAGAKRNSEMDFMESSYINPNKAGVDPAEADFGGYGGMNSNAGSASYRDYYNVGHAAHYVWMGYDYHTGTLATEQHLYGQSDTAALANTKALGAANAMQGGFDSATNARTDDYVDIYVDPTVDCSGEQVTNNQQSFDAIWNAHATPANKVTGETQAGHAEAHTIMGGKQGLGWLPYRYMRWTVALWNPANLNIAKKQLPYVGWAGTPTGSFYNTVTTSASATPQVVQVKPEADISYLAMDPQSEARDKIENDTGATYWSDHYDDTALNIQPAPSDFTCKDGKIYTISNVDGANNPEVSGAFDTYGVGATLSSQDKMAGTELGTNNEGSGTYQVCVPTSQGADFANLVVQLKKEDGSVDNVNCFSNNTSTPVSAAIDFHQHGAGGYAECKFSGT
jgi:hypothetical protein